MAGDKWLGIFRSSFVCVNANGLLQVGDSGYGWHRNRFGDDDKIYAIMSCLYTDDLNEVFVQSLKLKH